MNSFARQAVLLLIAASLSACGLFGGKDDETEPRALVDIETTVDVDRLWSQRIGKSSEFLRVALRPTGDGNRIYAASFDGNVVALDPENGREVWKTNIRQEISAGPGVGQDRLAIVTKDGELIVFDATNGNESWRRFIEGESLAKPLVRSGTVVVLTVDNRLRAYGLLDGKLRWTIEESTPALTIRGNSSPVMVGNTVIAGFDNGRIMAINVLTGEVEWQQLLSPPTGRSDLERLADVDGSIAIVGQDVYAAGYQGRLAALAAESGQALWARELSTYVGVQADFSSVYTTLEDGEVVALSRRTGSEIWRNESLLRREGTLPVPFASTVAVGDLDGYLHFFDKESGDPVARVRPSKAAISNPPLVVASTLYVQSDDGRLHAYQVDDPRARDRSRDIADGN